jgi:hypothetical protein
MGKPHLLSSYHSEELVLLLPLWTVGNRVVHHAHSVVGERCGRTFTPHRHGRPVAKPPVAGQPQKPTGGGRLTRRRDNQFPPIASRSTACSAWAGFAKGGPSPQIPKPLLWASSDAST